MIYTFNIIILLQTIIFINSNFELYYFNGVVFKMANCWFSPSQSNLGDAPQTSPYLTVSCDQLVENAVVIYLL